MGSIPGSGRSPGEGSGNPLQYSCLGNPMDRGAWQAIVHDPGIKPTFPASPASQADSLPSEPSDKIQLRLGDLHSNANLHDLSMGP